MAERMARITGDNEFEGALGGARSAAARQTHVQFSRRIVRGYRPLSVTA